MLQKRQSHLFLPSFSHLVGLSYRGPSRVFEKAIRLDGLPENPTLPRNCPPPLFFLAIVFVVPPFQRSLSSWMTPLPSLPICSRVILRGPFPFFSLKILIYFGTFLNYLPTVVLKLLMAILFFFACVSGTWHPSSGAALMSFSPASFSFRCRRCSFQMPGTNSFLPPSSLFLLGKSP